MNCEIYYDKRDKGYVVHFANNNGIPQTEIQKIFSVYGTVVSIKSNTGLYGLHFVIYENVEDAIKCIKGFRYCKDIKLLPHKHKINKKNSNNSSKIEKSSMKATRTNGQNTNIDNISVTSETDDHNDSGISGSSRSFLKLVSHLKQTDQTRSNSTVSSEMFDQNSSLMNTSLHKNNAPAFIPNKEAKLILAQEVIVANLHPNTKVFDILQLFEEYHPILSTFIMQIPGTKIRYCHIYFEAIEQALAVEKKFDKYALHEETLIVLRPETMSLEAHFM